MLVCVDDFPRGAAALMSTPIAARAAQVAEAEKASRRRTSVISDEVTERERRGNSSEQFKIRLFIMSTPDKSSSVRGNDLQIHLK